MDPEKNGLLSKKCDFDFYLILSVTQNARGQCDIPFRTLSEKGCDLHILYPDTFCWYMKGKLYFGT